MKPQRGSFEGRDTSVPASVSKESSSKPGEGLRTISCHDLKLHAGHGGDLGLTGLR